MAAPNNDPKKTWDFTLNNFTDADVEMFHNWEDQVNTMVVSKETGEGGTPHLQGKITFKRAYRFSQLKKLHDRVHWEQTKACADALYCMKSESEVIINVYNKRQGKRSDLMEAIESAKRGASAAQLWKEHPAAMVRYSKGIMKYREVVNDVPVLAQFTLADFPWTPFTDWSRSHILHGPAGCGKTQFALAHFSNPLFVRHLDDLKKLDVSHDGIVFDDMNFRHLPRESQIHLVDIDQPSSIHLRFENAWIPAGMRKIFTTNVPNGEIFFIDDPAVARRVTVTEVTGR